MFYVSYLTENTAGATYACTGVVGIFITECSVVNWFLV